MKITTRFLCSYIVLWPSGRRLVQFDNRYIPKSEWQKLFLE